MTPDIDTTQDAGYRLCAPIACVEWVIVGLDANCEHKVDPRELLAGRNDYPTIAGWELYIEGADGKALPGNVITEAEAGKNIKYLIKRKGCPDAACWGWIKVEDKQRPSFVRGELGPQSVYCFDANFVLNNPKTVGRTNTRASFPQTLNDNTPGHTILSFGRTVADEVKNLGYAQFEACNCAVDVKWVDRLITYGCDSIAKNGLWGRIERRWTGISKCNGMIKDTNSSDPLVSSESE